MCYPLNNHISMSSTQFCTLFGTFQINRLPSRRRETLRGWDAADEYLLNHLFEGEVLPEGARVLVINDQFGALAVSLHPWAPHSWSDSSIAHAATQLNLGINGLSDEVTPIPSTEALAGEYDVVLLKVPKTLALLEHQLALVRPHLHKESRIIAAGMVKGIHRSTLALFERYLGPTTTSLAKKKARLIFPTIDDSIGGHSSPYPTQLELTELGLTLSNHANLFSREQLDIGSRFMLQQYELLPPAGTIVDLGCGNGVLGIMAKRAAPESQLIFIDESYMAVASARENYITAFGDDKGAQFITHDCFPDAMLSQASSENGLVELVLCNPPFHQQNTVSSHIAERMINQSRQMLRPSGELWLVGNRHLNYAQSLKRSFGGVRQVAANRKFVVLRSIRR